MTKWTLPTGRTPLPYADIAALTLRLAGTTVNQHDKLENLLASAETVLEEWERGDEAAFREAIEELRADVAAERGPETTTPDLTKIATPFGLLDAKTQDALVAAFVAGADLQSYSSEGAWKTDFMNPSWAKGGIYRVKPEPVTVSMWSNVYKDGCGCSYASRKLADKAASKKRLAVLRIDITDHKVSAHIEKA